MMARKCGGRPQQAGVGDCVVEGKEWWNLLSLKGGSGSCVGLEGTQGHTDLGLRHTEPNRHPQCQPLVQE